MLVIHLLGQGNDHDYEGRKKNSSFHTVTETPSCELKLRKDQIDMKLKERIEQLGATGYILLWLLGIPIPVLFLFFLLRGCN